MLRVRGLIAGLMMSIVAMYAGYCQTASLTANYDAFLQAYYEWEEDFKQVAPLLRENPPPEPLAAFHDKTRELATAAVQWCYLEPGPWRRFWWHYDQERYVTQKPAYTPKRLQELCKSLPLDPRRPKVHYWIVFELLRAAMRVLPSEQERVAWARQLLELSLQFYQSPQLRQGADRYLPAVDPFADRPDGSALVAGLGTDFSYQAGLWRERAKEARIKYNEPLNPCEVPFEVVYSPVPLLQPLPPDEPDYRYFVGWALTAVRDARYTLQKAGALPADDWLLIAGWQVWQLPKDKAFICVREGELYLSRRALQQLQVRFVVERDRVVIWSGSYRQAVLLDGKDGFREGKEVWVRLLALQEKGLFVVNEYKVSLKDKEQGVRMFRMLALRPVADESDKQEER
jgi:hypothetical protein